MNKPTQRRFAAIISAAVVGLPRLMGMNEVDSLATSRTEPRFQRIHQ